MIPISIINKKIVNNDIINKNNSNQLNECNNLSNVRRHINNFDKTTTNNNNKKYSIINNTSFIKTSNKLNGKKCVYDLLEPFNSCINLKKENNNLYQRYIVNIYNNKEKVIDDNNKIVKLFNINNIDNILKNRKSQNNELYNHNNKINKTNKDRFINKKLDYNLDKVYNKKFKSSLKDYSYFELNKYPFKNNCNFNNNIIRFSKYEHNILSEKINNIYNDVCNNNYNNKVNIPNVINKDYYTDLYYKITENKDNNLIKHKEYCKNESTILSKKSKLKSSDINKNNKSNISDVNNLQSSIIKSSKNLNIFKNKINDSNTTPNLSKISKSKLNKIISNFNMSKNTSFKSISEIKLSLPCINKLDFSHINNKIINKNSNNKLLNSNRNIYLISKTNNIKLKKLEINTLLQNNNQAINELKIDVSNSSQNISIDYENDKNNNNKISNKINIKDSLLNKVYKRKEKIKDDEFDNNPINKLKNEIGKYFENKNVFVNKFKSNIFNLNKFEDKPYELKIYDYKKINVVSYNKFRDNKF